MTFKPLLSATIEDTSALQYPALVSTKLDGIRCIVIDGVACSRNLKPIRNAYVQACIGKPEYNNLDGELIVGDPFAKDCYLKTNSGVMSGDGEPDFMFHVFDIINFPDWQFVDRLGSVPTNLPFVTRVEHKVVKSEVELLEIESELLAKGAEGVMVRSITGKYKFGRSTLRDGILGKLKRFADAEYEVVGYQERMHNGNEATKDALGRTERSMHQENMIGRGDLGALILRTADGQTFNCGTGFNDVQRRELWQIKDNGLIGRWAKVKSFMIGVKDLPRFPVFLGFRDVNDMGGA